MKWSVTWLGAIHAKCDSGNLESTLRITEHLVLTRGGIHFDTLQGRRWINDTFQTKMEELEEELRRTDSLARITWNGRGRVRSNVPEPLANRLGPLASEANNVTPAAPSSYVKETLGFAPPPRRQPLESRIVRPNDQNIKSSKTSTSASNFPVTIPAAAGNSSNNPEPAEGVDLTSVLLWNQLDPNAWGQYKDDMSVKLNVHALACRSDTRRMMKGKGPTLSGFYRMTGVNWLLAEQEQFSSATTLRIVELDKLPQDNAMGHLKTLSLTYVRQRALELIPHLRKGKFVAENNPNNKQQKMHRQFCKTLGQTPCEY